MGKSRGEPIVVRGRPFWAEVGSRELAPFVRSQEKMRHYTVQFHCMKTIKRKDSTRTWDATPIRVLALHLHEAKKVLVQYSLEEPDRDGEAQTLPEKEIRFIEPHLARMVGQALGHAGVNVLGCQISSHCTGSNLAPERNL